MTVEFTLGSDTTTDAKDSFKYLQTVKLLLSFFVLIQEQKGKMKGIFKLKAEETMDT